MTKTRDMLPFTKFVIMELSLFDFDGNPNDVAGSIEILNGAYKNRKILHDVLMGCDVLFSNNELLRE